MPGCAQRGVCFASVGPHIFDIVEVVSAPVREQKYKEIRLCSWRVRGIGVEIQVVALKAGNGFSMSTDTVVLPNGASLCGPPVLLSLSEFHREDECCPTGAQPHDCLCEITSVQPRTLCSSAKALDLGSFLEVKGK